MASTPEPSLHGPSGGSELLRLSDIALDYGQIVALKDVNLALYPSRIHALVGEHGAGKSSLGMIISGSLRPRAGTIEFAGRRLESLSIPVAHRLGIEMVYQQVQLNEYYSVAENIFFLDKVTTRHGLLNQRVVTARAQTFLNLNDFSLDPAAIVRNLNLPDRVLISILAALQKRPKLLILDEALEKLSSTNLPKVVRVLDKMRSEGMSILFITHRIEDVYDFADRVSIVKNGEILVTDEVGHIDKMNLLRLTYTQLYSLEDSGNRKREFNQYLKYYEAVLQKLPVNLIVVDAEERVKIVNELCKEYFHIEGVTSSNRPLSALLGEENGEVLALIREALRSDEGGAFYQVPLTINGVETISNVKTLPIFDEGQRIGDIIIIEDISEFDKLQKQVILSEKLASVGLLAAGVAHEINNPLEIVYNYLKYIKLSFSDVKLHDMVDELHEEITYIAGIIRNLLSLSGTAETGREETDLNEMIGSIIGLLRHSAHDKDISISFHSDEKEILLKVNRNEIKQVILNLVKNSFEAMPGGGDIRIGTSLTADETGRPCATIEFADTGPGIQSANLNDAFIPFYSTRKGKGDNIGLGLSICYGIIKRHEGFMRVKNLEHSGCQFSIELPLTLDDAPTP
ncbi:MAG: ATP-binding cassette domain-containing protein [Spirochaetia bacterium]|jgi:signal transduction histidine kinase/ABC-type ATPase involved in cell division